MSLAIMLVASRPSNFLSKSRIDKTSTKCTAFATSGLTRPVRDESSIPIILKHRNFATSAQKRATKTHGGKPIKVTTPPLKPNIVNSSKKYFAEQSKNVGEKKKGGMKEIIVNYFMDNPFISMVVVVPTLIMGVALLVRKDFQKQAGFSGFSRIDEDEDDQTKTPVPMYTSENSKDASAVEEQQILSMVQSIVDEESPALNNESDDGALVVDDSNQGVEEIQIDGASMDENATRDLLFTLGFRPHPSS